jgi:NitT/TauT family transport system permease protein
MTAVAPPAVLRGSTGTARTLRRAAGVVVQWAFSLVVGYAIWRWLVTPHFNAVVVADLGSIGDALKSSASSGQLWRETRVTLYEMLAGFGVGTVVGVVLALAIALLPRLVGKAIEPLIVVIYAAPKFVLVPIMFVRFGAGFTPRFYLVTIAVFPVIAIYMLTGLRTVDPDTTDVLRMYGANRRQIGLKLMLPHAASYLATAVVYVIPHALSMAIGAEILFATRDGLGGDMYEQSQLFNASGIYATLAVATALAVLLIFVTKRVEAWASPDWRRK